MTLLLEAEALRVVLGGHAVVRGVDIGLQRGESVAVIGPNGAGKSTLLAALTGLVNLSSGTVERHGRLVAVLQTPAMARRSAAANVELALKWAGSSESRVERRAMARAALRELKVEDLADRPAHTLSGGEARRVHLARGIVTRPDVLLLDEPFAGLDPSTRADLLYDAASVIRSQDRATLLVLHDRAEAWALADRVLVLIDGLVEASGSPAEVFDSPPTERVAAFVGYVGRLECGAEVLRLRPSDVELSPDGALEGSVARLVPVEDGVRLEVSTPGGTVVVMSPSVDHRPGETVWLNVVGGVRYPAAGGAAGDPGPPAEVNAGDVIGSGTAL